MRQLPAKYLQIAKSVGRYPDIEIDIGAGSLTLSGSREIVEARFAVGDTSKPAFFDTAVAVSSTGTITVDRRTFSDDEYIISGAEFILNVVFRSPNGSAEASAPILRGYITAYDTTQSETLGVISTSDLMLYTGVDFNPETLTYPCRCSDILAEAFAQAGADNISLSLDIDPLVNSAPYKADEPIAEGMNGNPYTCREIIAAIAGMNMGGIFIDSDGNPKNYAYGTASTTAVIPEILTQLKVGSETYAVDTVKIFKTYERMQKSDDNYGKLSYAPRFDDMEENTSESDWRAQMRQRYDDILHWQWNTAVATIQGVGEIEPGDRVTFPAKGKTVNMFVTGIEYRFANAHFEETLYSYGYTMEEYLMSPPKSTEVSTKSEKSKIPEWYAQPTDPALTKTAVKVNDFWAQIDNNTNKKLQTVYRRKKSSESTADDPVYEWKTMFNAGGGSGVGEWLDPDHTNERFNDYTNNAITGTGTYNHVEGRENTISNGTCNHVQGSNNRIGDSTFSMAAGENNILTYSSCGFALCKNSILATVNYSFVSGTVNTVSKCAGCIVNGSNNNVSECYEGTIVSGYKNEVHNATAAAVFGVENLVTVSETAAIGYNHKIVSGAYRGALAIGNSAIIGGDNSYVFAVGGGSGNVFAIDSSGNIIASGSTSSSGADYAEYFEWADGNPDNDDRCGMLVMLSGDKIVPAHGDNILGAISARASVVGNAFEEHWHGKYITDVYGRSNGELSPEYDPERKYVPRSQRSEWDAVGLFGRLIIRDDGSCKVGEYVSARHGIGTSCYKNNGVRVLRRIDKNHIEVLIK